MKNPSVRLTSLVCAFVLTLRATAPAADLVWTGATGDWNAAGNWSPAQVPTSVDNVWITNGGTYTVTVPAGTTAINNSLTLGGASGLQSLAVDRATLTLNGQSLVDNHGQLDLLVSQSVVTGPGNLVVKGGVSWINGTFSGTGLLTINNGGTLAIGSAGTTLSRTLNNGGITTWAGGNLTVSTGNSINNLAGTTFEITADGRLNGSATTPFNNSGLLRLTAGTTGTTITAPVNNSGTVSALASSLSLNLGGSDSGTFSTAAGASLNLGGGSHIFSASSIVTGSGNLAIGGGAVLNVSSSFDPGTTLTVNSGTASLAPACNVANATLNLSGSGALVLFNTASSVGSIAVSAGTLGGTSPVSVTGGLALNGGTITNGLVFANGGLSINGNTTLNGARLVNPLTAVWSAGNITGLNGAAISNLVGAAFFNSFDGNIATGAGATPVFYNAGIFAKTNGTAALGATSIDFLFLNSGTVEVSTNTLRYASNQQLAGLTLLDGGALSAQAQPIQILGGSLVGTGQVTVANAQNVINSSSIEPGSPIGELDITGNYQQTTSGALHVTLGGYAPGSGFDLVTVSAGGAGGVATLGGTLSVSLTNSFAPTNGTSFTFLTAASRVGTFAAFNYPSNDIGMQLSYDATSASVKVTNLKPTLANPIGDPSPVTYGSTFLFQVAANTFSDPDGDSLTYSASGFPAGLSFDPATRTFSGTPGVAGVFTVKVMATDSGTPNLTVSTSFTLSVNPAVLTIAAAPQAKLYGAADPILTYTIGGLQFTDTAASVLTGVLSRVTGEGVAAGPYAISQGSLLAGSNYVISFTGNALSITPAPLSVTADSKSKMYGAADPVFTGHFDGFVTNETPSVLSGQLAFARAPGQNVGTYAIVPSGLSSANYAITFTPANLAITPAGLSVNADNKTKVYGAVDPVFTVSYSGFVNGDTSTSLIGTPNFSRVPGESVGTFAITPGGLTSANYNITFNAGTLSINPAALSVNADDKLKTYGTADPAFTASYSGLVNGDTVGALAGTLVYTRAPGENAGGYTVTPAGLTSANYTISYKAGTLTIAPAGLSVTADDKSKGYGAADPAFTVSYAGFVNGDTATGLGGAVVYTRAPGEGVGAYAISPAGLTSSNYVVSFIAGTLTITAGALSITADDKTKPYGSADPVFTASYTGFANGDTAANLGGSLVFSRVQGEGAGSYPITPSGLTNSNYTLTFKKGNLAVTPAVLSVSADNKTKTYGAGDPTFTVSYSGFVNGETAAVLGGTLAYTRAPGESVGTYAIVPSGLVSSNYSVSFNTGLLSIGPALLSVSAENKTKTYGALEPVLSFTVTGLQFADTRSVLSGSLTRASGESVAGGPYAITQGNLVANSNYTIGFTSGVLNISPAPLTITADNQNQVYGGTVPALTLSYTGFVNGDTAATLVPAAAVATLAVSNSPVGTYAISVSGAANPNYAITLKGGTLTVTRASLVITANAASKTAGSVDPAFTVSYSGFVNGESSAVLGGNLVFVRVPGETVGAYSITPGGFTSANYSITFQPALLTITPGAPALLPLRATGTGEVAISWLSESNATYRVQYITSLDSTNWTDLPGDVLASAGTSSKNDIITGSTRFYRVKLIP